MTSSPWAIRCPEGHAGLNGFSVSDRSVRCVACGRRYARSQLVDLSSGSGGREPRPASDGAEREEEGAPHGGPVTTGAERRRFS